MTTRVTVEACNGARAEKVEEVEVLTIAINPDEAAETEDESEDEEEEQEGDEHEEDEREEDEEGVEDGDGGDWESNSLFEELLIQATQPAEFGPDEDAFTLEEGQRLRDLIRRVGETRFLDETIRSGSVTAKKLITAFGIRPPSFLEGAPDSAYFALLSMALARTLREREKLPQYNTLEDVTKLLRESQNIIVLTGAGISTSLGIPDFRSKGSGLYSRLEGLGLADPQEVFDLEVFQEDPTIFYAIAKDILPTTEHFSPTHAFIELLQRKDKLLTQYTQNIDNLETKAGIRQEKLIQCHGSFAYATCVKCGHKVPGERIFPEMRMGKVAKCEVCLKLQKATAGKKRKRGKGAEMGSNYRRRKFSDDSSADEEENTTQDLGVMKDKKPDIIFFGEQLPATFNRRLVDHDRAKCDLFICIGTSLKVAPVSEIIGILPPHVPQIYISKTPVTHVKFDIELIGSCDDVVAELSRRAFWDLKHDMIPENHEKIVKTHLEEGTESRWIFTREE